MRLRAAALVALLAALVALGLVARRRRRQADALAAQRAAAALARAADAVDACLFGADAPPTLSDAALLARARRIALHPDTDAAWPGACARDASGSLARALADGALADATRAFREGRGAVDAFAWVPLAAAARRARPSAASTRTRSPRGPRALASVAGDVVPASIAPGATVAGSSAASGTLSVLFLEPTGERVFCRTRDRGATVACRRLGAAADVPSWLVGNDGPEALLLRPRPRASVAPADALATPVFSLPAPLVASLVSRVAGDALLAVADVNGAASLARCPRGAPCVLAALDVPAARDGALLSTGQARWWFGVAGPESALSLDARRLTDAAPEAPVHLGPLTSTATLFSTCHAPGVAYVAVIDGARAQLFAAEGAEAPRRLGAVDGVGAPAELTCDGRGATLVGATRAQGCERRGGCPSALAWEGRQRVVRVDGELAAVSITRDGAEGIRARHGAPGDLAGARAWAVDDDAAHGGVSAHDLWLFAVDDHLVLFASGATTTVLWSGDRGERWQASREPVEARPMRLGTLR